MKATKRENTKCFGKRPFRTLKIIFTNKQAPIKVASETLMSGQTISYKEYNKTEQKSKEQNKKIILNPKNIIISGGDGVDAQAQEIHARALLFQHLK